MAHKEEKQQVIQFLNENSYVDLKQLKQVFPAINKRTLYRWVDKWKESLQDQPKQEQKSNQLDTEPNYTPNAEKDSNSGILAFLNDNREILEKVIVLFKQDRLSVPDDKAVVIAPPYKPVNFSLMESLVDDFKVFAETQGISQRQAMHRALKFYIDTFQ